MSTTATDDLDATDFFCGMGGSSSGLVEAGFRVKLAANHWDRAIETHSANHPRTEHLCADLQNVDVRYLPKTRVLWASPICTEVSPGGGIRKKGSQADLWEETGHVPNAAFERTRVTFWEVIRAAEVHRYDVVMIENVVESADWELFDVWVAGMRALGYEGGFASANSAHIGGAGNAYAPQWRDRIYGLFARKGINMPPLEPRPLAWCEKCGENVEAMQWWKPKRKRPSMHIGKYGKQYVYVCPAGHGQIEPWVAPALDAIDLTDLGTRIGDRKRPLGASSMRRVQQGLDMIAAGSFSTDADALVAGQDDHDALLVAAAGQTWDSASSGVGSYLRVWPAAGTAQPAVTTTAQLGLVTPGKLVMEVNHDGGGRHFDPSTRPMPTETVKRGEGLLLDQAFVTTMRRHSTPKPITEPLATFTSGGFHHSLVIPYRRGARPYPTGDAPLSTMATREQHGVMHASSTNIEDAYFRMLRPREAANAQRFARDYIICGTQGEQQMQAGNAVSVNAAHWIGQHVADALDSRAAA